MQTIHEIVELGHRIYDDQIRDKVEPQLNGQFLVIDVSNGEYEVDADQLAASRRLRAKYPDGPRFVIRIGFPTTVKFGGRSLNAHAKKVNISMYRPAT